MGSCCGYLRSTANPAVYDPAVLENIKAKCEMEIIASENQALNKSPSLQKNEELVSKNDNNENMKINSAQNNSSQENLEKHGTCSNKDDVCSNKEDAIIIKKIEENKNLEQSNMISNAIMKISEESSPSSTKKKGLNLNLKPANPDHRRDSRSTTSINANAHQKKNENIKKIDLNELKLSQILIEKIQQMQTIPKKKNKTNNTQSNYRSITMVNDFESVDCDEKDDKDDEKTKEEITKELKENKEIIERNHRKITFIQNTKVEEEKGLIGGAAKNIKKKKTNSNNQQQSKVADDNLPRKSLLKRYKTIGNEKEKKKKRKKVQFQDLVDKKKKKKGQKK